VSKFLFTTLPTNDLGLLTRSLPVARELAQRGHAVVFCSPAQAPRRLVAETGFDNLLPPHPLYHLLVGGLAPRNLYRVIDSAELKQRYGGRLGILRELLRAMPRSLPSPTSEVWSMDHALALLGLRTEGFVRANCAALRTLILESEADVVVDFWNPFAAVAARASRRPLITIIQADQHPASRGFIWWRDPPLDLPTAAPVVNRVLAEYDLPPITKLEELSVGDLTLILGTPETDPLPREADVTYVGSILWQKAGATLPDWVAELDPDKPLIWAYSGNPRYAAVGTAAMDSAVVLHACVEALAGKDVQVVLTTGHHALPRQIQPLPANFRHEAYVPGLDMARRSDLLIHHGGYGSCQTGLYTGTPAVIIPTYSERESNARRVAALGAGEFLVPESGTWGEKRLSANALWAKVERVLCDPAFAANARRVGEMLRTYGGAATAAGLIDEFVKDS
jgi:UDP:flavonoid glycosyltransferase YjiC (YdhE family)